MKILIIQTAFIGDVILATSLIEETHRTYPQAQIDFLLRSGNESIIETSPHITNLFIWEKKKNKIKSLFTLLFKIRKQRYDAVINIQRFMNSGILTAFSGAKIKVGFHSNPLSFLFTTKIKHKIPHLINDSFYHEVQRNSQLLKALDNRYSIKAKNELKLKLYFTEDDKRAISELHTPSCYFMMAPSSVWYTKQWHADKWRELIRSIDETIYLIGAPSDFIYCESLYEAQDNVINLCGKMSLRESALLMQNAERVFVNDSAPLHLASSVNAKVSAIFCSTIPAFGYGPIADEARVLEVSEDLNCRPCGLHGHKDCPKIHFKCAINIEVQSVLDTIKS